MTPSAKWTSSALAVMILCAGAALVRLATRQQMAERRAAVTAAASASANSVAQKLAAASLVVDHLRDELAIGNGSGDFNSLAGRDRKQLTDDTVLLLLPAAGSPPGMSFNGPAVSPLKRLQWEDPSEETSREPALLGPVRLGNGEWMVFLRAPLFLGGNEEDRKFRGWVAAAVPVEGLLRAAGFSELAAEGLNYQVGYFDRPAGGLRVVASSTAAGLDSPVEQALRPAEGRWSLRMTPVDGWIPWTSVIAESLIVLLLALIASLMMNDLLRRPAELEAEMAARDRRLREIHERLGQEIEQREELEKRVSEATSHDAFTGLPNASFLMDRLSRALQRSRLEPGYVIAVLILNFGRYKSIVETLGAAAGDQMLTQAVKRVEGCLRPDDMVLARVADDEFATLLFDIGSPQAAAAAAKRLSAALAEPFVIGGRNIFAGAKMGIALSASGYDEPEELVRSAHMALSQVTADSQEPYAVFDPATREQLVSRHQLETDLYQAIERKEFRLYFQPIVSLETGRIAGMEALIRWMHPLEGLLAPARFIPLAEETGLVVPITRWVVAEAVRQARVWRARFPADVNFYISANLSAQDLRQPDVCDFVAALLAETGLAPGILRLEVTESMMIGSLNAVSELVSRFRAMGVPLLLDDFGTGYSSLSYLNRFQFDYIKIDRAFVSRIGGANQSSGIVKTIVHLAQDMGARTIAEGVDNEQMLEQLRRLGCDYAQGYYFSKPVDVATIEQLLLARPIWLPANSPVPADARAES